MRRHPQPTDIEHVALDMDDVRRLPAPSVLRNERGALYLWDGTTLTRRDGTIAHVEDDGPWKIAAISVAAVEHVAGRTIGVDARALYAMLRTGRDLYAESVGPGPAPAIPYRQD